MDYFSLTSFAKVQLTSLKMCEKSVELNSMDKIIIPVHVRKCNVRFFVSF